ncbi:SIS domain-containing protein [Bacteroidota bacterium]
MIKNIIKKSIDVKSLLYENDELIDTINKVKDELVHCFSLNGKVYFCGNGGSAADAQHIAAELSGRFYFDRPPLAAEALHVNSSYITAVANDYSYDEIFSRYINGMGRKDDVLIGLSTSGNSVNIIKALDTAKKKGMITVGMTGASGGKMKEIVKHLVNVPSDDTPRIQEVHMLIGHIISELVEKEMFS